MLPPLFFLYVLLFAIAGPQVVLSRFSDRFKFEIDAVRQCEPVFLDFKGTKPRNEGLPITTLTVLPIGRRAISIPLGQVNITDQGINVSFIPLAEGTTFLASLDDEQGENVSLVSDILRVQASSGGDTSCIRSDPPRTFTLVTQDERGVTQPRQCEPFQVTHDNGITGSAEARLYRPNGPSHALNKTDVDENTANYTMTARRGQQMVLLFKGDNGIMEASDLLTVGGDTTSPDDCFNRRSFNNTNFGDGNSDRDKGGLNRQTVMGLAIGGGIVILIAIVLISYLFWERRNRRRVSIHFDPSLMEKRSLPPSEPSQSRPQTWMSTGERVVQNPPYTADTRKSHTTMSSWAQVVPSDYHEHHRPMNRGSTTVPAIRHSPASSLQSFQDIEGILNSQEQRVRAEQDSPLPSPISMMESPAAPAIAYRGLPARGQLQDSSSLRAPSPPTVVRPDSSPSSIGDVGTATNPFDSPRELPNPHTRASSGLLLPPVKPNRSHFSTATESSFGGFDTDRISGVPESVVSSNEEVLPPRRPLPSAGLGRGNGEPR